MPQLGGQNKPAPTAVLAQTLHDEWDQVLGDDEIARTVPEAAGVKFAIKTIG